MKLRYVSITGADDAIDLADLDQIAAAYPFVEFAILCMPERMGENRFPSADWIRNFSQHYTGRHKAMHLCGSAFLGFASGDAAILELMSGFHRVQLNLKFGDVAGRVDFQDLIAQVKAHPEFEFIFQYGEGLEPILPLLSGIENHAILFDESAGTGTCPAGWPAPLPGHSCGYAGGLNPENLAGQLEKISSAAGPVTTWIDMESGVRSDDLFDLAKVRRVLDLSRSYCL
ncbi:MAG: hypothetical protein H6867_03565 [Rhodospirillales bacterium]|nr:hypothetical protein [Rhodospirillales bacterium]MCB9996230.1 hypothetical protein [Rhodospirillales bacterium]